MRILESIKDRRSIRTFIDREFSDEDEHVPSSSAS